MQEGTAHQEFVSNAKSVVSTFYPGETWNATIGCSDPSAGSASDGVGACTGTSMAAPSVAGLFGLLRSVNPMLRCGDPFHVDPSKRTGLRSLLQRFGSRTVAGMPESMDLGFGTPNAQAAVRALLGVVAGRQNSNRATPLFGVFSAEHHDHAALANPQHAASLLLYSSAAYVPEGELMPMQADSGSPEPAYRFANPAIGGARAIALILSTESPVRGVAAPPTALYLLERRTGCTTEDAFCHGDFALASSVQTVNAAIAAGYSYAGRQGYLYRTCSPDCAPDGTQILHSACRPNQGDCATFLEQSRQQYAADGYVDPLPGATSTALGYAYPVQDSDGEGLPDGMEWVIGTSPQDADSDDDGQSDHFEFPFAGIPQSDPCSGPNVTCLQSVGLIFRGDFE